jgi:hypothetical protein
LTFSVHKNHKKYLEQSSVAGSGQLKESSSTCIRINLKV